MAQVMGAGSAGLGYTDDGKAGGVQKRKTFRINTATNRVDATWPIPQCRYPDGLAIDTATHRIFASCENQRLVVVNTDTGALIATLPIGRGTDAVKFDPARRLIFSSNGFDGTLSVTQEVSADSFVPVATVRTALSGRTMESIRRAVGCSWSQPAPPRKRLRLSWGLGKRTSGRGAHPSFPALSGPLFLDPAR